MSPNPLVSPLCSALRLHFLWLWMISERRALRKLPMRNAGGSKSEWKMRLDGCEIEKILTHVPAGHPLTDDSHGLLEPWEGSYHSHGLNWQHTTETSMLNSPVADIYNKSHIWDNHFWKDKSDIKRIFEIFFFLANKLFCPSFTEYVTLSIYLGFMLLNLAGTISS